MINSSYHETDAKVEILFYLFLKIINFSKIFKSSLSYSLRKINQLK